MQCQVHEGGVPAAQVILYGVVDEADQIAVAVHQHRDKQVALKYHGTHITQGRISLRFAGMTNYYILNCLLMMIIYDYLAINIQPFSHNFNKMVVSHRF